MIIVGISIGFSIGQVGAASSSDSLTLYDFSRNTGEWVKSDNVKAVEVGMYDFGSEDDPDLRSCLKAESHDLSVGLIRTIEADFASPLDLTEYRSFSYEIYACRMTPTRSRPITPASGYFRRTAAVLKILSK